MLSWVGVPFRIEGGRAPTARTGRPPACLVPAEPARLRLRRSGPRRTPEVAGPEGHKVWRERGGWSLLPSPEHPHAGWIAAAALELARRGGVLLHASAVLVEGRAHLFLGPSGAGKSTTARLLSLPLLSEEIVGVVPGTIATAFGTEWRMSPELEPTIASAALGGIHLLERGSNAIVPIPRGAALPRLLSQVYSPPGATPEWSRRIGDAALALLDVPIDVVRRDLSFSRNVFVRLLGGDSA